MRFAKIVVLPRENNGFRGFGHVFGGQVGLGMAVSKALERQVDPGMAFWGSLGRQVGPEPAVWRTLGRQVGFGTAVSDALWRFGGLEAAFWWLLDVKLALKRCFGSFETSFWKP